jgi:UDP-N-acetylmuramyl tripeptide synthase
MSCERKREQPQTSGSALTLGLESASFELAGEGRVEMPLTGLYNVYNALAAVALCRVIGLPESAIRAGLAAVQAAFGRQEVVDLDGRRLRLLLAKNPAGANQVLLLLRAIAPGLPAPLNVALLLNDRFADGQDVSWIWDVDHELLAGQLSATWAGGDRAEDLAVRMKYAGWPQPVAVEHQPAALLDAILGSTSPGDDIFVVPTYTAMRDLREELHRRGAVAGAME